MPRAWSSARYTVPLPDGHRFPIAKYAMIRDAVAASGLLDGGIEEPDRVERWALSLVHTDGWVGAMSDGTATEPQIRRLGFPWSAELRERSFRTVQATLEAARDALDGGIGMTLAGGTHHAFPDRGEGYCVFNDVAVAIKVLQREGRIRRAAIIDLDVHQGNGTASIFGNDPDVFTFSMHGRKNYPFHKELSRLDVELEDGCGDSEYLELLDRHLDQVFDDSAADLVFYLGGADPYAGDRLGRLKLSIDGLALRDRAVFEGCHRRGLPVVLTMAGGYAEDIVDLATIHSNSVRELLRAG